MTLFLKCMTALLVAFAAAFFISSIAWAIYDDDNLLSSDDPYIIGFICGSVSGIAAAIDRACKVLLGNICAHAAMAVLLLWTAVLAAAEIMIEFREGEGLLGSFAVISLAAGWAGIAISAILRFAEFRKDLKWKNVKFNN